jgi:hypothetical protein
VKSPPRTLSVFFLFDVLKKTKVWHKKLKVLNRHIDAIESLSLFATESNPS